LSRRPKRISSAPACRSPDRAVRFGSCSSPRGGCGNNCDGFAVDIIAYGDGSIFDVLGDGGGENKPQSIEQQPVDPTRFFAPFLGTVVQAVVDGNSPPPQPPPPSPTPLPSDAALSLLASLERIVTALEQTVSVVNALNTRLDTIKMSGIRVHL
jgi:hypothetical protein